MIYSFSTSEKIRLDEFLRRELPLKLNEPQNSSNSKIRRLIVAGAVFVNSRQVRRPAFELRGHSKLSVDFDEEKFLYEKQPDDIKFELTEKDVLYEDEYLICVNKPSLFPTEETIVGGEKRDNLHDAVVRYLWAKNPSLRNPPYVGIMHRLDRETSGVILFTKQRTVNKQIQEMFAGHDFKKVYKALVTENKTGFCEKLFKSEKLLTIEKFMNRISPKSQAAKWGTVPENRGGMYSKTVFALKEKRKVNGKSAFLLEADLFTGRTHQIRVHLSEAGLPIVGDELYGGIPEKRIMLHAEKLEFNHPVSGDKLMIIAQKYF